MPPFVRHATGTDPHKNCLPLFQKLQTPTHACPLNSGSKSSNILWINLKYTVYYIPLIHNSLFWTTSSGSFSRRYRILRPFYRFSSVTLQFPISWAYYLSLSLNVHLRSDHHHNVVINNNVASFERNEIRKHTICFI